MDYSEANDYIQSLNQERSAGYSDWRMPTTEELMSLLEPEKQSNGLFIDPIFDDMSFLWSADKRSSDSAWDVHFSLGFVYWSYINFLDVRAVRSWQ